MIKTFNLTKKFNQKTAVNNLSLHVKKGEIYGFIGPNGAGKTTTIKMLAGILLPTAGKVEIAGFDIKKEPLKAKKQIGYIPDIPYIYPHMTGREFLHFVAQIYEVKNKKEKIKKLLKIFPLENMIDGYFKDFSRGTQQKLTILAALLHDPNILIIDEPILGLDPVSSQTTKDVLEKFKKGGGSVFVSTHTLSVVQEICDHIGIIDNGKLIFSGSISQLKNKLKTKEEKLEKMYFNITK
ncbi:ABC transporter ATP-binding protein [Patescibacteria group bacterium]